MWVRQTKRILIDKGSSVELVSRCWQEEKRGRLGSKEGEEEIEHFCAEKS